MARTKNPAQRSLEFASQEKLQAEKAAMEMKETGEEKASSILDPKSKSSLPTWTRFPSVLVMSLFLSSVMYSVSTQWTHGELASVSRKDEGWSVLAGLLGWRTTELALAWFRDYDSYDLVSLVILSHYPPLHLLTNFYNVSSGTAITSLIIDALAAYIPFRLLRPVSPAHKVSLVGLQDAESIPNEEIVADHSIKAITTLFAAVLYSTTLYGSYATFLPTTLVTYFNDIPTIEATHNSAQITVIPLSVLLGLAAHTFIFTPAVVLSQKSMDFDPVTATLAETIWYNVWGWSERTKKIIKRTVVLAGVVGVNGLLQTWATIEGVEATGAAVYSSVWVTASLITGTAFAIIADV